MALPVFPSLSGLSWPVKRAPAFKTTLQEGDSGRRTPRRSMLAPRWNYELKVEFLRTAAGFTEFTDLLGLYLKCCGRWGTFLFSDADDNSVTDQLIGVGDGSSTQFFLLRTLGGFDERIAAPNGAPTIKVNGTVYDPSTYSIDALGVVTFTGSIPAGQAVTWSGAYRWICRFDDDQLDLSKFMSNFWEVTSLKISSEVIVG